MEEKNQIDKLGDQLTNWVDTIIKAIESGEKIMVHKSSDYTLKPTFYPDEMKFQCTRNDDGSEGKLYLNIYEIEQLYNSVKKKVFKLSNTKFPKTKKDKKQMETPENEKAPVEGKKLACSKFIMAMANETKSMAEVLAKANEAGYDIKLGYVKNINKKYNLNLAE